MVGICLPIVEYLVAESSLLSSFLNLFLQALLPTNQVFCFIFPHRIFHLDSLLGEGRVGRVDWDGFGPC